LDESINLTSAIQLVGYSSVIGNLWKVQDKVSAEIAREVYARIIDGSKPREFDARRAAEGLHEAVRKLRGRSRVPYRSVMKNDPLVWAPYMHVGI